ncbi:hypothetical protein MAPG_06480 [Magnaporthiopsis poae ATCC 64411]|uniref:Uncharacterized protein n=1 Tax=Magnaporthiopsis poae (strain ATCC 64411 / 73-15) TaxID=644358 RepID=A0A0C4E252_MAGP6|nr:hypothetical protein MAPG_06480 [Magnaporthiopsis poae ATCC 64411]
MTGEVGENGREPRPGWVTSSRKGAAGPTKQRERGQSGMRRARTRYMYTPTPEHVREQSPGSRPPMSPQSRAGSQAKDRREPSRAEQEAVWSTGPRPSLPVQHDERFPILSTIRPINPLLEVPLGDGQVRAAEHSTSASSASHPRRLFPARKRFQQADWMLSVEAREIAMPRSRSVWAGLMAEGQERVTLG